MQKDKILHFLCWPLNNTGSFEDALRRLNALELKLTEQVQLKPESIELFPENQAVSPSYDLAPPPPSCQLARPSIHNKTEKERQIADEGGRKGVGEEPNHTTAILYG